MNTNATGASARQSGFSAHAVPRNSPAATRTAAHACASVSRPDGSSRARVRGFFASRSRSAIRLKPSATQRAHVNASTTSASSRHVTGCSQDATSKPSSANGSANRVWGSLTKLTYRTRRLPPAKVWPSRRTSELDAKLPPHRVHLLLRLWIHHDPVRPLAREPFFLPFASGVDAHLRAEGEGAAGVVEHVDRPQGEPHVALGVDVVERHPPRLPRVLNVHILIEHDDRSEEHTSELQSRLHLVCRLLLEKKKKRPEIQSRSNNICRLLLGRKQRTNTVESRMHVAEDRELISYRHYDYSEDVNSRLPAVPR